MKLWKEVMKCKNVMLLYFQGCFFQRYIFEVATFFSPSTYPINLFFSLEVRIYKIHIFDKAFILQGTVAKITEKFSVPISMATTVRETNYLITIMQFTNPNYP